MNALSTASPPSTESGLCFQHFNWGSLDILSKQEFGGVSGKLFLKELLGLTGMEVSANVMAPGQGMPFCHRHRLNEELYIFLSGSGQFMVGDAIFAVGPGSCVRVVPQGIRCWRNTGDEPLHFLCIQAPAGGLATQATQDGIGAGRPHWNRRPLEVAP